MPGHILYAQCPCGFERKLSPGSKIAAADFVDYKIAYNADESDLLSENERDHQVAGPSYRSKPVSIRFQTRFYPCPHANFERKNAAQGPYLCPQCKTASLTLLFFHRLMAPALRKHSLQNSVGFGWHSPLFLPSPWTC